MELLDEICKEHSKRNTVRLAKLIGSDTRNFSLLMDIVLNDLDMDNARKAAWIMRECVQHHPSLFVTYKDRIISYLQNKNLHGAIKRNALILLRNQDLKDKQSGLLIDYCFDILQSAKEPTAVKAQAIDIIYRTGRSSPKINHELRIILEDQSPFYSTGLLNKARKVIKLINQHSKYKRSWNLTGS